MFVLITLYTREIRSNCIKITKFMAADEIVDKVNFQSKSNRPQENFGGFLLISELRPRRSCVMSDDLDNLVCSFTSLITFLA